MLTVLVVLMVGCAQATDPMPPPPPPPAVTYTVTFDVDGGSAVASQTIVEGKCATQPTAPTKTGYTFGGWNFEFDTPINDDKTVYANWSINTYTINFSVSSLAFKAVDSTTVVFGGTATLTAAVEKDPTWHFTGWSTKGRELDGNIDNTPEYCVGKSLEYPHNPIDSVEFEMTADMIPTDGSLIITLYACGDSW